MKRKWLTIIICTLLILLAPLGFFLAPHYQLLRHSLVPALRESAGPTLGKTVWKYTRLVKRDYPKDTDIHLVEEFQQLNAEYRQLKRQLQAEAARGTPDPVTSQNVSLLWDKREKIRPYAEAVVEQQVAAVAGDEGLVLARRALPPPKLIFANAYYVLVTSPRNEIRVETTRLLGKDLTLFDQEQTEQQHENTYPDTSALVQPVGGLAVFYPAQIFPRGSIRSLLELSAHEWLHQYLFVASPLGRAFLKGGQLHTINETVVNMLGRELGDKIYLRYYASPEEEPILTEEYSTHLNNLAVRQPSEPQPLAEETFSYTRFMRATYLETARLLGTGQIDIAERYMEEQRQTLLAHGYTIRKLNQAFFAFHGSYADSPTAINNIGPALARLRLQTSSPQEFLVILKPVTTYTEFIAALESQGIAVQVEEN
ncbi:MAG: hypothetical protein SCK29_01040 [Bacillota bacterium]|nr:hypothetical protein [Bacillota bacterium]MDW7682685.1 hypothetical protein [Bacillota bacterium]